MRPDRPEPGSAADWLRLARADLVFASVPLPPGGLYNILCFHAQQAVEKSLKGVLMHYQVWFRPTHDIAALVAAVRQAGIDWPRELAGADELTRYAVFTRYPGPAADVSEAEYRRAVAIAEGVYRWAETLVTGPTGEGSP
jgi:HEPN domain-containing protein